MGGIRYSAKDDTLEKKWRAVALNVLRRLRQDCLNESQFSNDCHHKSVDQDKVYLQTNKHLQYWCDVAGVSRMKYIRLLRRDKNLLKSKEKI